MNKYFNPIPQVVQTSIVDKNFMMTPAMKLWMTQLVTYFQQNLSNTGYLLPQLTTSEINSLNNVTNGTMVYDVTLDIPKMKRASGWETITTTP